MADLVGEYRHKLDAKGRITLPSAFRKVLSTDLKVAISPQDDECLYVFEPDGFSAWVDSLFGEEGYNPNNRKHVMFRRVLNARAKDVQIDAAGRIGPFPPSSVRPWVWIRTSCWPAIPTARRCGMPALGRHGHSVGCRDVPLGRTRRERYDKRISAYSVLLAECLEYPDLQTQYTFVDGTLGGAGHSYEAAKRIGAGQDAHQHRPRPSGYLGCNAAS